MNIYEKLQEARKIIRETKVKKAGTNSYSKYDYFTPEQVENLVSDATEKTKTICLTSLTKDEFGYSQKLKLVNLEDTNEFLEFELRTEKPTMTASNDSQQMGGMDTYSERYIKMKVFQIKDNNLDFDGHDNRPSGKTPDKTSASDIEAQILASHKTKLESSKNMEELKTIWASLPPKAMVELESVKETLKKKYASS